MFDSYVLTFFYKLYCKINSWYSYSYLKKISNALIRSISNVGKGSFIVTTMSTDNNKENIVTYRLYKNLVNLIEKVIGFCRNVVRKYSKESYTFDLIEKLFNNKKTIIETTSIFTSVLSLIISILNFSNRGMSMITIVPLSIFVLSTLILISCRRVSSDIEKSFVINSIKSIFAVDSEGESRWKL